MEESGVSIVVWLKIHAIGLVVVNIMLIPIFFVLLYIGLNLENVVDLLELREIRESG